MLIAAEVDPKTISRLMGHSSVAFTLDQYAKVFARHEKDHGGAVRRLSRNGGGEQ